VHEFVTYIDGSRFRDPTSRGITRCIIEQRTLPLFLRH